MIFGGSEMQSSKNNAKHNHWDVFAVEPTTPSFLHWSKAAITFNPGDHLEHIPALGRYALFIDSIIGRKCLTMVLMDGGIGLNILYTNTLDAMGIDQSWIRLNRSPLLVMFGTPTNYLTKTLKFEVVRITGSYHAILGQPCYAKFMAVANYTYLKLKMPGPKGIITMGT